MSHSSSSHSLSPLASATDMPTVRLRSNSVSTEAAKASAAAAAAAERMHGVPQPQSHQSEQSQSVPPTPATRPPRSVFRTPPDNWSPPSKTNPPEQQSSALAMKRLIQMALEHSKDEGETLDLSRQRLDKITDDAVEMFQSKVGKDRKGVWRLALSYNQLRDGTISPHFSSLNRLRYLNLKSNLLTFVPPCVCVLPVGLTDIAAHRTAGSRDTGSLQESAHHIARVARTTSRTQGAVFIRQPHCDTSDISDRVRQAQGLQGGSEPDSVAAA